MSCASRPEEAYPGAGIAHNGNETVQQHHGHGEDKQQQQDDPDDWVVAVVEQVQVRASQHDGEEGHKGVQNVAELLQQPGTSSAKSGCSHQSVV